MPLRERQLLDRLRKVGQAKNSRVALGIGDDCAILRLPRGQETLVTTDFSLENVHFRRDWQSPECIGHRCLARGLSDIAAMGGTPVAIFLSLALPADLHQKWVDRFLAGLLRLARAYGVELAGGDTAQSSDRVLADIMVVGSVKRGQALLRSGAKAGDLIYVTGELGESAAVLHLLASGKIRKRNVFAQPRIAVGEWLVQKRIATSAIDISDGLSTDLSHICEESGVGATLDPKSIPLHAEARKLRSERLTESVALHGGEDYEILFTAPKSKPMPASILGVKVTCIGQILKKKGMSLHRDGKPEVLLPKGWEHFQRHK